MTTPHPMATHTQADEIAECMGVDRRTYDELWNKCVPLYDGKPKGEYPGEMSYGLVDYGWDLLTEAAQEEVNRTLHNCYGDM
jgi:hypothetical protein